jgi:hypothetical protein
MTQVSASYTFDDYGYRLPPSTLYYLHLLLRLEGDYHRTWTLDWNRDALTAQEEEMVSGSCLVALLYLQEAGVLRLEPGRRWLFGMGQGSPRVYREHAYQENTDTSVQVPVAGLEALFAAALTDLPLARKNGVSVESLAEEVLGDLDDEPWRGVLSVQQELLSEVGILRVKQTEVPRSTLQDDVRLVPNMAVVADYAAEAERVAASLAVLEHDQAELCRGIRRDIGELL